MIYLHTGQPGAGKTLFTLQAVRERAKAENRPVFYAGIELLKIEEFPNWQVLENPEKWFECPDGAIIVHDECQTLYRPRGNAAQVPECVARFETHRHQGHDVYLITQHPMLVDSNIRRLAGEHVHVVRSFGAGMATLHKWGQVKEQCDKARADSVSETRAYPKALYGAYKSATLHTHKARIPPRVWFLVVLPVLLAGLAWVFWSWYQSRADGSHMSEVLGQDVTQQGVGAPGVGGSQARAAPSRKTIAEWLVEQRPRVEGLPHTAPVYDGVTQVTTAPVPAVCIAAATRCQCYTQQGTRMQTADSLCRQIAENGYFLAFDPNEKSGQRQERATAPPAAAPGAAREARGGWQVEGYAGEVIADSGRWGGVPPLGR